MISQVEVSTANGGLGCMKTKVEPCKGGIKMIGTQEGKELVYQSLPVVAIELILYIYRRAVFQHRATPTYLPLDQGNNVST